MNAGTEDRAARGQRRRAESAAISLPRVRVSTSSDEEQQRSMWGIWRGFFEPILAQCSGVAGTAVLTPLEGAQARVGAIADGTIPGPCARVRTLFVLCTSMCSSVDAFFYRRCVC